MTYILSESEATNTRGIWDHIPHIAHRKGYMATLYHSVQAIFFVSYLSQLRLIRYEQRIWLEHDSL